VVRDRVREPLEPRARRSAEISSLERLAQLLLLALGALQGIVEAAAPLAERRVRLREQPRDRREAREVDAAAGAAEPVAVRRERLVATRAREALEEIGRTVHRSGFGSRLEDGGYRGIVAAAYGASPCTRHVM